MRKVNGILVVLLLVCVGIITVTLLPPYLADFSVMTKSVTTIVEVNENFLGTDILVPEFVPFESDPYAYASVQNYTLSRSRQKGKWDGYAINITPKKPSGSNFYELIISARTTDGFSETGLSWELQDITHHVAPTQNFPSERYSRIMGTFQKGPVYYEVSGELMGVIDIERRSDAIAELQLIIDHMDPVTSVVKEEAP